MSKKSGLGKALKNKLQRKTRDAIGDRAPIFYQQTEQNDAQIKKLKMKSVLQQNSLTEFLQTAQLTQQNFKANRDIKFRQVRQQTKQKNIIMLNNKAVLIEDDIDQNKLKGLQMPRRPKWDQTSTKQDLTKGQNQSYLAWRRGLAQLQQNNADVKITPYQKNIQVWKQLWRVTQRANLIVQIVDGRDPLFFRSEDLVDYVNQVDPNKKSLLLINKSDLVPEQVRVRWNKYLNQHNINHIFFSAVLADKQLQQQDDNASQHTKQSNVQSENSIIMNHFNKPNIVSIVELKQLFNEYVKLFNKQKIQIGLVGYPNVGKSSVINTLLGKKKVGVASMPGKTKHFQTLILNPQVTLVDCPGLVFPRISASHAYMILNGLYPVDSIRSFVQPMRILAQRINKSVIQKQYFITWKQNQIYDAQSILNKYSTLKGFITGNGLPNQAIAARNIIKDYINGVIVYARQPPGLEGQIIVQSQTQQQNKPKQLPDMKKKQLIVQNDLDNQFFKQQQIKVIDGIDIIRQLTQDDLLDILSGGKVSGIKITKQMRANIKFALKRGDNLQQIKKKCFGVTSTDRKKLVQI